MDWDNEIEQGVFHVLEAVGFDNLLSTVQHLPSFTTDGSIGDAIEGAAGDPHRDANFWRLQTTDFTCAVEAQGSIIEAFTGECVDEVSLATLAAQQGWLTVEGGTLPELANKLLDHYGIDNHVVTGATIGDVFSELAFGHKIIVGVDGEELWHGGQGEETPFEHTPNHAITLTGVDLDHPDGPVVYVNDSGDPHGAGRMYDLQRFVEAWEDSGFHYIATDDPAPDFEVPGFDANAELHPRLMEWLIQAGGEVVSATLEEVAGLSGFESAAVGIVSALAARALSQRGAPIPPRPPVDPNRLLDDL